MIRRGGLKLGLLMVLTLFYLVNQTGREVTIRVLADGHELLVQQLGARVPSSPEVKTLPLLPPYPAVERKIALPRNTKRLEIEEPSVGHRTFEIAGFPEGPGFRVVIRNDGIVTHDYYPIRSSPSGPAQLAPR